MLVTLFCAQYGKVEISELSESLKKGLNLLRLGNSHVDVILVISDHERHSRLLLLEHFELNFLDRLLYLFLEQLIGAGEMGLEFGLRGQVGQP